MQTQARSSWANTAQSLRRCSGVTPGASGTGTMPPSRQAQNSSMERSLSAT